VPPKVEYSLTEMGTSVMPVIKNLCAWGSKYEQQYRETNASAEAV